jgi:DNA-binding transcriptional ArsR family regulator
MKKPDPITAKLPNPQVVTGPQGRDIKKRIVTAFGEDSGRKIMQVLDQKPAGHSYEDLLKQTGLPDDQLRGTLQKLQDATLLFSSTTPEGKLLYALAD